MPSLLSWQVISVLVWVPTINCGGSDIDMFGILLVRCGELESTTNISYIPAIKFWNTPEYWNWIILPTLLGPDIIVAVYGFITPGAAFMLPPVAVTIIEPLDEPNCVAGDVL